MAIRSTGHLSEKRELDEYAGLCRNRPVTFADIETADDHRFTLRNQRRNYARLMDAERSFLADYETVTTVLLTFTVSPFTDGRQRRRPPIDHLDHLSHSRQSVNDAIRYAASERDSMSLTVIGAHGDGYGHRHTMVWIEGAVDKGDFRPAVDAHLRHVDDTTPDGRDYDPEKAVSVEENPETDTNGNTRGSKYVVSHLIGLDDGLQGACPHERRLAAILWASGRRAYRPSQTLRDRSDAAYEES